VFGALAVQASGHCIPWLSIGIDDVKRFGRASKAEPSLNPTPRTEVSTGAKSAPEDTGKIKILAPATASLCMRHCVGKTTSVVLLWAGGLARPLCRKGILWKN
jgi:hypothetical protein